MAGENGNNEGPRSKRTQILTAAIESFGDTGFDLTKWADVAEKVGIGQTALYHYFESKVHCLLTIMSAELEQSIVRFEQALNSADTPEAQLRAAVKNAFDVTAHETMQMRILQNHMDLLATPRLSEREETERQHARKLVRKIEENWLGLIEAGIESGDFSKRDARQTSRALLALLVSVWRWYRPGGPTSLDEISDFMTDAALRLVGP